VPPLATLRNVSTLTQTNDLFTSLAVIVVAAVDTTSGPGAGAWQVVFYVASRCRSVFVGLSVCLSVLKSLRPRIEIVPSRSESVVYIQFWGELRYVPHTADFCFVLFFLLVVTLNSSMSVCLYACLYLCLYTCVCVCVSVCLQQSTRRCLPSNWTVNNDISLLHYN